MEKNNSPKIFDISPRLISSITKTKTGFISVFLCWLVDKLFLKLIKLETAAEN
ncbi:hypothetical protein D3C72_2357890 [compost metagenome]